MAKLLKLRRGSTSQHSSFTGAEGEVTIDTTKDTAVVHDGSQAGGRPLAREDMSNVSSASIAGQLGTDSIATSKIAAGTLPADVKINTDNINNSQVTTGKIATNTIVNGNISGTAAIAGTKIAPNFGSQNIANTGNIDTQGYIQITNNTPSIYLTDANNNPDYILRNNDGTFVVRDGTNGADRLSVGTGGISVTGSIIVSSTVDGRDVASDGSKLDGIESGATADQTASEIRSLVESASDSNVFTDADHNKLNGIESGATGDQTNAEIRAAVEAASDSNVFTDADHSKLNGIESGATADQSGGEIATALRGQTIGTSSDGVHDVYNDDWFRNNNSGEGLYNEATTQHFYSDDDDYWNIAGGTGANGIRFRDDHAGTIRGYVYNSQNNDIGFLNNSGSWSLKCDSSGNVTATGNVTAYSDARLKTDIHTINDALSICGKLRGVSYKWLKDDKPSIGVIAQEVEEVLPEVVLTQQVKDPTGEREVKSVDYGKIVGVLINAINELKAELDEHKKGGK